MSIFFQAFQQKKGALCLVNDYFLISKWLFFARSWQLRFPVLHLHPELFLSTTCGATAVASALGVAWLAGNLGWLIAQRDSVGFSGFEKLSSLNIVDSQKDTLVIIEWLEWLFNWATTPHAKEWEKTTKNLQQNHSNALLLIVFSGRCCCCAGNLPGFHARQRLRLYCTLAERGKPCHDVGNKETVPGLLPNSGSVCTSY